MGLTLDMTESLCPVCLVKVPARIVAEAGGVFLEKSCPAHGDFRTVIWRGDRESYEQWVGNGVPLEKPAPHAAQRPRDLGCPYDCGLCPDHAVETCSAALMVTNRCNLDCPVCFTRGQGEPRYEPSLAELAAMLDFYQGVYGESFPLELCGGEPTVREDLTEVISLCREKGFSHLQVNSNGVKLARDPELAVRLRTAGATVVYLGFDGVNDDPYLATRGAGLFRIKMDAVANCARAGLAVVLVPMLIPAVNIDHIGGIIEIAKTWSPTVRGVYFQPISYFGAYPDIPGNDDRLTIPEVLNELVEQSGGEIAVEDFLPPACEHPLCSFNGLFIVDRAGRLKSLTRKEARTGRTNSAAQVRAFTARQWRTNPLRTLSIGGMLFQDAWNIDLARLKRCIIHIISPDHGLTPLCAKYLTALDGSRLYPGMA